MPKLIPNIAEHLRSRVTVTPAGCWEWQGARDKDGYGQTQYKKKRYRAHRLSFTVFKRPLLDDEDCLHSCDNPPCICPEHLSAGGVTQNMIDMCMRGRGYTQKLSPEQVADIRQRAYAGPDSRHPGNYQALADEYGVAYRTICGIAIGDGWKQV